MPVATHEGLRDPGKFLTLDTKLLAGLTKVARGELAREILVSLQGNGGFQESGG